MRTRMTRCTCRSAFRFRKIIVQSLYPTVNLASLIVSGARLGHILICSGRVDIFVRVNQRAASLARQLHRNLKVRAWPSYKYPVEVGAMRPLDDDDINSNGKPRATFVQAVVAPHGS